MASAAGKGQQWTLTDFAVAVAGRHPVKPIFVADLVCFGIRVAGYLGIGMHLVLLTAPKSAALLEVRGGCCPAGNAQHLQPRSLEAGRLASMHLLCSCISQA